MTNTKMQWTQPQLIILTRGTLDESVLSHCKAIGYPGTTSESTNTQQLGCDTGNNENCGACQARSGS